MGLKVQNIFLTTVIGIAFLFSALFVLTYLSPDQSYATSDQLEKLRNLINQQHRNDYERIRINCLADESRPFFNKLVFIVIDAFRSDFVNSIAKDEIKKKYNFSMPFVERLLNERRGLSAISRAQTPTVTLPKLKTILSGSISNFIDILFNLNAAEFGTDNLISQALMKKKRIIFYGDDTWLQMFNKSSFIRSNETLSFFARDYTSVDTNVTENMKPELNKTAEWDIMILHYLGVDHIGHNYGGINSKLLPAKLAEMDDAVKVIYESLSKLDENYLVFLTGDHGMTDLGNHGGNTIEEINTGVLLFTTDVNYQVKDFKSDSPIKIEQNDVTNLLSFYLGLQIPNRSKGKLDLKLIDKFGDLNNAHFDRTKLCYLFNNALQLQKMEGFASIQFINYFFRSIEAHSKLVEHDYQDHRLIREAEQSYDQYLNIIQRSLVDVKNENQNLNTLLVSIFVQIVVLVSSIYYQINSKSFILKELFSSPKNAFSLAAMAAILINISLLGSTSFIEMEHHYFNYIASTLIVLHGYLVFRKEDLNIKIIRTYFLVLLCLAISSNWTSLINAILSSFDSDTSQKIVLFMLIAISFLVTRVYLTYHMQSKFEKIYFNLILVQIFIFKLVSFTIKKRFQI